ncbi:hypothetical protein F4778DRAFT_777427 [Xylariomycetidae sp. FL2044]|nr:hypothetical protein F4778DRAFT_777427 [Xylariomycetidae sp. FL2044]
MSSAVAELEAGLNAMQALKPPGVSGSRIQSLTKICVDNVQSESVLIQKIYTHFKKVPATHKLGVLYVVDSVTRRWVDHAKQQGQAINSSATDGTYAAGVHRVTELLPVLMNDILQNAPGEQKEKIKKLVDIWEKGSTFPLPLIESFKEKLNAAPAQNASTTPLGSPPPGPGLPGLPENKPPAAEAPNAIMEALKSLARQNMTAPPTNNAVSAPANPYTMPAPQPEAIQQPSMAASESQPPYGVAPQSVNLSGMPFSFPQMGQHPGQSSTPPMNIHNQAPAFPGTAAPPPAAVPGVDPSVQHQVALIKSLADSGVPFDKIPAIIAGLSGMQPGAPAAVPPQGVAAHVPPYTNSWGQDGYRQDEPRDHGFHQSRSPNRFRDRSRSRSPPRHWGSPRGRNDREFGNFGRNSPAHGFQDDHRGRGSDYRQRSPPGRRGRSPSPGPRGFSDPGQKWTDYDRTVPQGHIKVLSRTLFVGGVTCPESELRSVFNRHGQVQTCIVNKDKRHAFVKMVTRDDALNAKKAMENSQFRVSSSWLLIFRTSNANTEKTRWGVGFGPRDCSDYQTGISIIPIHKLTDADRKWMLTAEFGGSGGKPIETGLVVEEPDIEIGAGVSSKAISRRMQTDKGGRHGPKSSRGPGGDDDGDLTRWRRNRDHRRDNSYDDSNTVNNNAAPQFPFGIGTGANGMPIFPEGFTFPAPPNQ